jgi:hypothetical protein
VEICLHSAKFLGFPQNTRVYDDFPTHQESKCRLEEGLASTAAIPVVVRALET